MQLKTYNEKGGISVEKNVLTCANEFHAINELALKGEIVIFGSTYLAEFPFYELVNRACLENAVYNRSIAGITLKEAAEVMTECVLELQPRTVVLHLGEEDEDTEENAALYEKMVIKLRAALPSARLLLVTVSKGALAVNERIDALCDEKTVHKIQFLEGSSTESRFRRMSAFFRNHPITFSEAFAIASL